MTIATIPETFLNKDVRKKKLILAISDIPMAATGVAVQFNQLITYMLESGEYMFYVIGGAVKHPTMDITVASDSFVIEPCVGQGNKDVVRARLAQLQPDALFIFTDPHQYIYLWEMADEVKQLCPIVYWHVWDNDPYPDCNTIWYKSTDYIGAISKLTYDLVRTKFPDKVEYIPHTFSPYLYFPLPEISKKRASEFFYKDKSEWFKLLFVNRNGHRKQLIELLGSFKMFLDELEKQEGHRNAVILLRTETRDPEGPDINANIDILGIRNNVIIIEDKLEYSLMNVLYNSADLNLNVSKAEGFGLTVLSAMNTKTLCAGVMTGGVQDQLVDSETGEKFGLPIKVHHRNLVGSQLVPYIYEDYASREDIKNAILEAYKMPKEEKNALVEKAYQRATNFFGYSKIMTKWKDVFDQEIKKFKETSLGKNQWSLEEVVVAESKEKALAISQMAQLEQQRQMMMMQQMQQQQMQQRSAIQNKQQLVENVMANLITQQNQGVK